MIERINLPAPPGATDILEGMRRKAYFKNLCIYDGNQPPCFARLANQYKAKLTGSYIDEKGTLIYIFSPKEED